MADASQSHRSPRVPPRVDPAFSTTLSDDKYGVEAAYKHFHISILAGLFLPRADGSLYVAYGTLNVTFCRRALRRCWRRCWRGSRRCMQ